MTVGPSDTNLSDATVDLVPLSLRHRLLSLMDVSLTNQFADKTIR